LAAKRSSSHEPVESANALTSCAMDYAITTKIGEQLHSAMYKHNNNNNNY